MALRSRRALAALLLLGCCAAAAAALPAASDRLDGVKKDIRLKNFAGAAASLQGLATAGDAEAQYLLANADPPDPQAADHWLSRARELGFSAPARQSAATGHSAAPLSLLPAASITDPVLKREALWLAASAGNAVSALVLADAATIAATDEFGRGALARAAEAGSGPVVELLVARGAPIEAADQFGVTPLMLAARSG